MLSVLIATNNGARTLPLTLSALTKVGVPDCGVEMVVVNNGSTDDSSRIIRSFEGLLPLTLVETPRPGKVHALLLGLARCRGDLIVMTDDDVIPDRDWLLAYAEAARAFPDVALFAGQVRHHWQKPPPAWLERLAAEGLSWAGTPADREAGPIEPWNVKGPNFAVRREVFDRLTFDERLGYSTGSSVVPGEETEFAQRAVAAGFGLRYLPQARVRHIVRPHEVTRRAVIRRYFRIGRGIERTGASTFPEELPTLFGYPRFLFRTEAGMVGRAFVRWVIGDNYGAMRLAIDTAVNCGRAYQWRLERGAPAVLPGGGDRGCVPGGAMSGMARQPSAALTGAAAELSADVGGLARQRMAQEEYAAEPEGARE